METHTRTIVKSLTWRVVALIITTSVAMGVTHEVKIALSIGFVDTLIKLLAYYLHERAWLKIKFGITKPAEFGLKPGD